MLLEPVLVDLQSLEVRGSVIFVAGDGVDDDVGIDVLENLAFVVVDEPNGTNVLAGVEHLPPLPGAHYWFAALEARGVLARVETDPDLA